MGKVKIDAADKNKGGRKRVLKDKKCSVCSNIFRPKDSLQKHCSAKCAYQNRPKKGVSKNCICGKDFYVTPYQIKDNNYCSQKCASKGMLKNKPMPCKECGKEYYRPPSQVRLRGSKYCSKKCKGAGQKKKYAKARSEKSKYPKELNKLKKWVWKAFSDYVRERDNWTCFTCGKQAKGAAMHAGHFVSRVRSATMFDEKNVHAQCYACNIHKSGNGAEYAAKIIELYGKDAFDDILFRSRQTHKFTYEELEQILQDSRRKLKELLDKNLVV